LGDFLGTFTDNPGRRLLSIQIGVFAGILVAAIGGLDVVAGVQNQDVTDPLKLVPMTIGGVIFTGLMMGLGSSPTHEVIQTLQQYKRQRKAASAPTGTVSEEDAGSGSATPLGELGAVTPLLSSELGARSRVRFDAAPEDAANSHIKIESPVRLQLPLSPNRPKLRPVGVS